MERLRPNDPEAIGPYKLIARLGAGGMGTVFLGSQGTKKVAIKVAREGFLDDPSLRTRFEREVASLQKMDSPYIARFFDSGIEEDFAWHAVEFVNGPTLADRVDQDGPLDSDEWLLLAEQLRLAISDVHRNGIVHRDLKPSNIVLSELGMKLIDFGIAWDSDQTSVTTTGMVAGSPAWLSPEQLDGLQVTPASDMFSAGSVLMFAATGRSPWGSASTTSVSAVVARIASHKPDLSGLTAEQKEAIEALIQAQPEARRWQLPEGTRSPESHAIAEAASSSGEESQLGSNPRETVGKKPSLAKEFLKTLLWPAVSWAIGLVLLFGAGFIALVSFTLLLGSLVWLVVQAVRFFKRFGAMRVWLAVILAIIGWVLLTLSVIIFMGLLWLVIVGDGLGELLDNTY